MEGDVIQDQSKLDSKTPLIKENIKMLSDLMKQSEKTS